MTLSSMAEDKGDEELAVRAAGDFAAFAELYERYLEPVYRYVRAQTNDRATAEDLTAQVFYKALTSAGSFRGEGSYRSWVFSIARNTVSTWRSTRKGTVIPIDDVEHHADPAPSAPALAIASEDRGLLQEAVARLPEAQREVVRLRYFKELPIDEIARLTRRRSDAVRALLHRGRDSLRKRLRGKDLS